MRLSRLFFFASLVPLVACLEKDDDDDKDEVDESTLDNDEDGLTNGEEEELGTDPDNADTDGDGFGDYDEANGESDPTNGFSWPYDGGVWPDFSDEAEAAGVDGDTYGWDEVFPNFATTDQFGNDIELYQFYGNVILIDFAAGWCGPCRTAAEESQEMWTEYREDGFIIIHALTDDNSNSGEVDEEFLTEDWADEYDITFPVVKGDSTTDVYNEAYAGLYRAGLNEGYIPYMILLDQDMKLVEQYVGAGNESAIASDVEDLLGL